jgi:clan AA aspartic protease (TIGR02281 family)
MEPQLPTGAAHSGGRLAPRRGARRKRVGRPPLRAAGRTCRIALIAIAFAGQPVSAQPDFFGDGQTGTASRPGSVAAYSRYRQPSLVYGQSASTPPGAVHRVAYSGGFAGDDSQPLRIRRDPSGSFVANVLINGVPVRVIIDTGAQCTILSLQDARQTGADQDVTRSQTMAGIGGYTQLAVTRIRSMNVGGQQLGGFNAVIGQAGIPYTLLGQSEISRLGRIVIEDGVMTISAR